MKTKHKKWLLVILKGLFSGGLLFVLLGQSELETLKKEVEKMDLSYFLGAMGLYFVAIVISSFRWKLLLNKDINIRRLFSYYLIGGFFNNFLPTMVGGDMVKAYYLYKETKEGGASLASVFMDRYVGFIGLLMVVGVSFLLGWDQLQRTPAQWLVPLVLTGFVVGSLVMWQYRWDWFKKMKTFYEPLMAYKKDGNIILSCVGLSLVVQIITIMAVHLLGIGMEIDIPWYFYYIFVPLTVVVTMIPVSISGFGVREGAMVYFMGSAGVENHAALTLSLIWYGSVMAVNLLGGVEYARLGYQDKKSLKDLEEGGL